MSLYNYVRELAARTGCSLNLCNTAVLYAKDHDGCTAIGFLKAKCIAVATPNKTFEERVRYFSEMEARYTPEPPKEG